MNRRSTPPPLLGPLAIPSDEQLRHYLSVPPERRLRWLEEALQWTREAFAERPEALQRMLRLREEIKRGGR